MLDELFAALRTAISTAWPEVADNGVWESAHTELIPWETLTPPYAVIAIEDVPPTSDYGPINAMNYLPAVMIYYVCEVAGPLSPIRVKLEALRDHLWQTPLSYGQVMTTPSLNLSRDLEPNHIFVGRGMAHRAGRLTAEILIGQVLTS